MKSKPVLALLGLVLVGLLSLAFWLLDSTPAEPASTGEPPVSGAAPTNSGPGSPEPLGAERQAPPADPPPDPVEAERWLQGRVRDTSGRPVPDAVVRLRPSPPPLSSTSLQGSMELLQRVPWGPAEQDLDVLPAPRGAGSPTPQAVAPTPADAPALPSATSDEEGLFRVPDPSSGIVWFEVEKDGYHLRSPAFVDLPPGDRLPEVELVLAEAATVEARVEDAEGRPIAGATVVLHRPFDPLGMLDGNAGGILHPAEGLSDEQGLAVFPGVPPGDYSLKARCSPWRRTDGEDFRVAAGERHRQTLRLHRGADVEVLVRDARGRPCPEARVEVRSTTIEWTRIEAGSGQGLVGDAHPADAQGRVRILGLEPGSWALEATAPGHRPEEIERELVEGSQELVLDLRPGAMVSGQVLDAEGRPLPEARVRAAAAPRLTDLRSLIRLEQAAWQDVDEEGRFVLDQLPEGAVRVVADAPGHETLEQDLVAPSSDLRLNLPALARIEGIVVSLVDSEPIPAFELRLERIEGFSLDLGASARRMVPKTVRVRSEDGRFKLSGIEAGRLRLTVSAPEHARKPMPELRLEPGERRQGLICLLERDCRLEGRVLSRDGGLPLAGATVRWSQRAKSPMEKAMEQWVSDQSVRTDEEGRFTIPQLAAGRWFVEARAAGHADASLGPIELSRAEQRRDLVLELSRGGVIHGQVVDAGGAALSDQRILAATAAGTRVLSAQTDAEGRYRIEGLDPGTWNLTWMPSALDFGGDFLASMSENLRSQVVELAPGEERQVDFGATPGGDARLHGTVRQAGQAASGVVVTAMRREGDTAGPSAARLATTDDEGRYEIPKLVAGPYLVQVARSEAMAAGTTSLQRRLQLAPGESRQLDLELPSGGIRGRLVDAASGEPCSGVLVRAAAEGHAAGLDPLGQWARARAGLARSGEDGVFVLRGLAGGRYSLHAGQVDALDPAFDAAVGGTRRGVEVEEGLTEVGDLRLTAHARLFGMVRSRGGEPLAEATIFLRSSEAPTAPTLGVIQTDAGGRYEYPGIPAGDYQVLARAPGRALHAGPVVQLEPGQQRELDLSLSVGTDVYLEIRGDPASVGSASAVVRDARGVVLSGTIGLDDLARLRPAGGGTWIGTFEPGRYEVQGQVDGEPFERSITLAGEPELRIPITLREDG